MKNKIEEEDRKENRRERGGYLMEKVDCWHRSLTSGCKASLSEEALSSVIWGSGGGFSTDNICRAVLATLTSATTKVSVSRHHSHLHP